MVKLVKWSKFGTFQGALHFGSNGMSKFSTANNGTKLRSSIKFRTNSSSMSRRLGNGLVASLRWRYLAPAGSGLPSVSDLASGNKMKSKSEKVHLCCLGAVAVKIKQEQKEKLTIFLAYGIGREDFYAIFTSAIFSLN